MERAEARRLQPHYIESFFREAFRQLGGSARQRETRRYQVSHVPAPDPEPRPGDRDQRASPLPLRTDRVREAPGRPARAAVGGFRLPGPSVARRRHRRDPGTPPRPAEARRGPRLDEHSLPNILMPAPPTPAGRPPVSYWCANGRSTSSPRRRWRRRPRSPRMRRRFHTAPPGQHASQPESHPSSCPASNADPAPAPAM